MVKSHIPNASMAEMSPEWPSPTVIDTWKKDTYGPSKFYGLIYCFCIRKAGGTLDATRAQLQRFAYEPMGGLRRFRLRGDLGP